MGKKNRRKKEDTRYTLAAIKSHVFKLVPDYRGLGTVRQRGSGYGYVSDKKRVTEWSEHIYKIIIKFVFMFALRLNDKHNSKTYTLTASVYLVL